MITYIVAILCVVCMAVGQILFKASSLAFSAAGTFLAIKPATLLLTAMCLYALTSLAWVWILQKIELGRVYPLMALAFVLVPVGSHLIFGERFQSQYFVGIAIIMLGIVIAVKS